MFPLESALSGDGAGSLQDGAEAGAGDVIDSPQIGGDFGTLLDGGAQRGFELIGSGGVSAPARHHDAPTRAHFVC